MNRKTHYSKKKTDVKKNTLKEITIYVTGNDDRIVISSQFDNLGKGASGAAVECMNLVLGCEATKGLSI